MPNFCRSCGMQNQDYANVCANCGAPFVNQQQSNQNYPYYPSYNAQNPNQGLNGYYMQNNNQNFNGFNPPPAKKSKKLPFIIGGAAVAIVAVIAIIVVLVSNSGTSTKKNDDEDKEEKSSVSAADITKEFYDMFVSKDSSKMMKYVDCKLLVKMNEASNGESRFTKEEYEERYEQQFDDLIEEADEYFTEYLGDDYKLSYEIVNSTEMTVEEFAIEDHLEDKDTFTEEFDDVKFQKIEFKLKAENDDGESEEDSLYLYFAKDDEWTFVTLDY